jgi:hypothetical protein
LASLQKSLGLLREKNQKDLLAVQQRRSGDGPSGNAADMKIRMADKERALERKKADLMRLKARDKNVEDRIALRNLNIAELELEKKTLLLDKKVKAEVAAGKEKTEMQKLQDQVLSQTEQEKYIRSKIETLRKNMPPHVADARTENETNTALKQQAAELESKSKALLDEQSVLLKRREALEKNKAITKIRTLNDRRDVLRKELAALKDKQVSAQAVDVKTEDVVTEDPAVRAEEIKALEKENATINDEIENLRENIAVLDYQVNSLERYRMEKGK